MPNNELRLFISSTFRDMQEEREHLVRKVFPAIRALCRERGVTFTEIDLRWGLTEEQATMGTVIRACLEEVDRCRPYFIGMIGDRYGWVPELHEIMIDPDLLARFPFVEELVLDGRSVTEMEFVHALFNAPAGASADAFFYHRVEGTHEADDPVGLERLIQRVRESDHPVRDFEDVEALGEQVRDDLVATIDRVWPADEAPDELEIERRAHAAFRASRTRGYIPDPGYLKEFNRWVGESEVPLLVRGNSGLGKSSLISYMTQTYRRKNPDDIVVEHYVGASPGSGTVAGLLTHVIGELCRHFEISDTIPSTEDQLITSFPNWLFRAGRMAEEQGKAILLTLDALNQLQDRRESVSWLPTSLPENVRLVVSTTPGAVDDELVERGYEQILVVPLQEERIRQGIVVRYLGEFRKSVSSEQLRTITGDANAESPLFLRAIAEELRLHGEFETIDDVIAHFTGAADLDDFFARILERFESDHGEDLVRRFMSFIALSRTGLHESNLLDLTGCSRIALSRLLFGLDYHLIRRDGLFDFFHDYLRRAVENRYLSDEGIRHDLRIELFEYARSLPLSIETGLEMIAQCEALDEGGHHDEAIGLLRATLARPSVVGTLGHRSGRAWWQVLRAWRRLEESGVDPEEVYRRSVDDDRLEEAPDVSIGDRLHSIARLLSTVGRIPAAEHMAGMMIELDEPSARLEGQVLLGDLCKQQSRYEEATTHLNVAMGLAEDLGRTKTIAAVHQQFGSTLIYQGKYREAIEHFEQALRIFEEESDPAGILAACGNIGVASNYLGEMSTALDCFERAAALSERIGDLRSFSTVTRNIGSIHFSRDELQEAFDAFSRSVAIDRKLGDRNGIGIGVGNIGNVQSSRGETIEALRSYREAFDLHSAIGFQYGTALWLSNLAGSLIAAAELPECPEGLEEFVPDISDHTWKGATAREARRYAVEGRDLSIRIGKPTSRMSTTLDIARIDRMLGDHESSRRELLSIGEWSDNPLYLATAYFQLWFHSDPEETERPAWRERSLEEFAKIPEEQLTPELIENRDQLIASPTATDS